VSDRAEVLHHLLAVHADAGVTDRDRLGLVVCVDVDRQLGVGVDHIVVGEHLKLDTVERIRGIGDQLAQKDLAVGVKRVRQDVEQLLDFGAVFERFSGCTRCGSCFVCHTILLIDPIKLG